MAPPPFSAELLTAGLIHELRQPLTGIKLGLQLLHRSAGEAVSRQVEWPMVLAQIARLDELLRSYQAFVTPDPASPTTFELGPAVLQAVELCRLRLRPLGGRFVYRPPAREILACGTPASLTHALTNLLHNALDATDEQDHAARLAVRVFAGTQRDTRIEVRVSDQGCGIAADLVDRVFEPRFTTKAREHGSGLGLSIARRMIEAVGGEVTLVEPGDALREPWAKTEFRIALRVPQERQ